MPYSKRLSKEQWQQFINEQLDSGMTQADYCAANELSIASFSKWKHKLRREQSDGDQTPQWIELPMQANDSQPAWDIELELPGNVILRMRR